ncbi:helix-turn-helix domain-containing protein [Dongia deserti]|uniref:helix-turn-helix domain-containing protein n=1 Tax=Dongia deserti TaxID=2268030 RepID=UPI0013C51A38|nr:helix-turn-helix domain-containing protein [Dongia deserti]
MQVNVHRSGTHNWALITRAPDAGLQPYVIDYQGYRELARVPMRRLQPPFDGIPMIVTFGPSIDIVNGDRPLERRLYRSFLAGLHDVHVFTEYEGRQSGFQVNFTLLGAYRFLNITMSDIANRCLDLGDLLGDGEAERLVDSLQDAADWPTRFDLMDRFLLERLRHGRPMSPDVAWALKNLQATHGARSIGALSRDLSCSRKTLIQRFHAQIGLSPKAVANILRFAHAVERIRAADEESWADLAIACGYYDQAHFNRDFRRYSGRTPREFQAALLPDGGGIAG